MKLTDIIELAKQGYTPRDIKELMSLNIEGSEEKPSVEDRTEEAGQDVDSVQNDDATQDAEQVLDYKAMFEASEREIQSLKDQLKASQKENTNKNMQGEQKNDQDVINDLARSFM